MNWRAYPENYRVGDSMTEDAEKAGYSIPALLHLHRHLRFFVSINKVPGRRQLSAVEEDQAMYLLRNQTLLKSIELTRMHPTVEIAG